MQITGISFNVNRAYYTRKKTDNVSFGGIIKYANTLKINPFVEFEKADTRAVLENYIRKGMFIHMPPIGKKSFGDVFFEEFKKLYEVYKRSKISAESIYNILELKALQLASKESLESAAKKQIEGRAIAIGNAAKRILNNINPGQVYLDIGSGDGKVTQAVAKNMNLKNIYGLEIGIRNDASPIKRTYFDGENIPFDIPNADFATIFNVLHHTKNDREALNLLKSLYKKLNKGAHVLIREHNAETIDDINYWQIRHLLPIHVSKVDPPCLTSDMVYHSEKEWVNILEKIGLKKVYSENDKIGNNSKYSFYLLMQK